MRHTYKILLTLIIGIIPLMALSPVSAGKNPPTPTPTNSTSDCSQGFSSAKCSACAGVNELGVGDNCDSKGSSVTNLIKDAINLLSYAVGIIAIIMIIVSGIRFATSGGSSSSVEGARKTLIYAIIGLLVAALTQVIVHWVLNTSSNISNTSNTTNTTNTSMFIRWL